jgi:hypothetical protein
MEIDTPDNSETFGPTIYMCCRMKIESRRL